MITDRPPTGARGEKLRRAFAASDGRPALRLPAPEPLRTLGDVLAQAMAGGKPAAVRAAADALLVHLADHFGVSAPSVRVLGVRPHRVEDGVCTYQLFGDYTPSTERIRVWMRTAIRGQVTSSRALLNTLLHELCHHLDSALWSSPESPHTRGFFGRIDDLYHHTLGTPAAARRPLHWVKSGAVYRIDWARSRTAPLSPPSRPPRSG